MNLLLFMGNGCFIQSFGGAERVACEMANEFTRRGWNVTIVCNDFKEGSAAYPLHSEVKLVNINGTGKPLYVIPQRVKIGREITRPLRRFGVTYFFDLVSDIQLQSLIRPLNRAITEAEPDVILPFFVSDLLNLVRCRAADDVPIVQMLHDTPENTIGSLNSMTLPALDRAACVQVLLESFVPGVQERCKTKTVVIPNAVPQFTRQIDYAQKDAYRIVNIARLEAKQKQQHVLIDAFAQVAEEFPNWTLHFYGADHGDFYHDRLLDQIRQHGLENRIFLEGTTDHVEETLLSADIFAFPSAWEGFGIALLEAMSAGLPTIGFRSAPAVNELIKNEENGLLTDDGAKGFALGLRRLMSDRSLRERLGRNGKGFSENYSPKRIWDRWEEILIPLAKQKRS